MCISCCWVVPYSVAKFVPPIYQQHINSYAVSLWTAILVLACEKMKVIVTKKFLRCGDNSHHVKVVSDNGDNKACVSNYIEMLTPSMSTSNQGVTLPGGIKILHSW